MSKIKGGDMMLFLNSKSIAYATSHTLTISGDTQDTRIQQASAKLRNVFVKALLWC